MQNGTLDLTANSGARLQATFDEAAANGTFTAVDGVSMAFTAVTITTPAGLYRSEGTIEGIDYTGGLIILPDGQYRGLVRSGTKLFIVDPDPLDVQDGSSNLLANVDWGDGIGSRQPLPFSQVKINE